ncbi:MAG: nucleoside phosphorylase [Nanoarchaeota archaeon]|nr:nucleoside phosphorylase [Nanoarchaeota archaeon]
MGFPNYSDKINKKEVYSPLQYISYKKKVRQYPEFKPPIGVILCYSRALLDYISKKPKVTKSKGLYSNMFILKTSKGNIAIVGRFGVGAPVAVKRLEELIAYGVRKFVSIGTAGTLQKDIPIGSIIVCEKAIRDEGTSYHYLKRSKYAYASKKLTKKIKNNLEKNNMKYFSGTSWTTDAPYRETIAEVKKYQKEGVSTVDMESSALFAVAKYRKVEIGSILTISDSLANLKWNPKSHSKKTAKSLEILFQVALDTLTNS